MRHVATSISNPMESERVPFQSVKIPRWLKRALKMAITQCIELISYGAHFVSLARKLVDSNHLRWMNVKCAPDVQHRTWISIEKCQMKRRQKKTSSTLKSNPFEHWPNRSHDNVHYYFSCVVRVSIALSIALSIAGICGGELKFGHRKTIKIKNIRLGKR